MRLRRSSNFYADLLLRSAAEINSTTVTIIVSDLSTVVPAFFDYHNVKAYFLHFRLACLYCSVF